MSFIKSNLHLQIPFFLFYVLILLLVISEECGACNSRKANCQPPGDTSDLITIDESKMVLKFSSSAADEQGLRVQLENAERMNKLDSTLSSIIGTAASLQSQLKLMWTLTSKIFVKMRDVTEMKLELLGYRIRNQVTGLAVHLVTAKILVLQSSLDIMTNSSNATTTRLGAAAAVLPYAEEILNLFNNKNGDLWRESHYTAPFLIDFAVLYAAISSVSVALNPDYKDYYKRQRGVLAKLLREYKPQVVQKRLELIQELHFHLPGLGRSRADELERQCGYTLYNDKSCWNGDGIMDKCGRITERKIRRPKTTKTTTTDCIPGDPRFFQDKSLRQQQFGGCYEMQTILAHNRKIFGVLDTASGDYFCGEGENKCLSSYKDVLARHINNLFDETAKLTE